MDDTRLTDIIKTVVRAYRRRQKPDGHWLFPLEADVTIPSEYMILGYWLGQMDATLDAKLANYIRSQQGDDGGWPLFHKGDSDISATVKAYLALRIAGDKPSMAHMRMARQAILARGGAERANVFTRITLVICGCLTWSALPAMPIEIILLPRWFIFHLLKVSYWSRTVIVPLLIMMAHRDKITRNNGISLDELFICDPLDQKLGENSAYFFPTKNKSPLARCFLLNNRVLARWERATFYRAQPVFFQSFFNRLRERAKNKAMHWCILRSNGVDGLGGIFPAMANWVMALSVIDPSSPHLAPARQAVQDLVHSVDDKHSFVQPCVSPVWDTGLMGLALLESGEKSSTKMMTTMADWLLTRHVESTRGDWAEYKPDLTAAGWPFQYRNAFYPDLDDTAMVAMLLDRIVFKGARAKRRDQVLAKVEQWMLGMQSRNGGWGSFDADNRANYLNHIPFADHGALIDPPTADVSARCVGFFLQRGYDSNHRSVRAGLDYLYAEQEPDGSWFGRWGTNYIYGTWSVLQALAISDDRKAKPAMDQACRWLKSRQQADGGWGEDGASYWLDRRYEVQASTPSQTAWALLALMTQGLKHSAAILRGIDWLLAAKRDKHGRWHEDYYTAVGFPRVFYLRYHGYAAYFPLWALGRYRNLSSKDKSVDNGRRYGL